MRARPGTPVVLLASSRPDGNTFALARLALPGDAAPLIDIGALRIGYFSYANAHASDDFTPLVEDLLASPLWVLATPLYWYAMSAQAKTFVDRLSDLLKFRKDLGRQLRGKRLAVLCAGSDETPPPSFEEPFVLTARYLGMTYAGCFYAHFEGSALADATIAEAAQAFGSNLVRAASSHSTVG